jgi:glycosyltransferase involved in cell wall biosynthesis
MKFLLLNQFYPPDPAPTGWYLHGLARELVRRGHAVRVFCSRRSYDGDRSFPSRETRDGVEVRRLQATGFGRRGFIGKVADYASFYASLASALAFDRSKPNLILSLTTPPYIGVLGKAAAAKLGCRHAHWIMDVYPDVMHAHRMSGAQGLSMRFLRQLTRFQLRGASNVLTLGPYMAGRIAPYSDDSASWLPLWSDPDLKPWDEAIPNPLRAQRGWTEKETVFLYSGNMGLGHTFEEFLSAAVHLGRSGPRWVFSGGGKRRSEIEAFARSHPEAPISLLGYVPHGQLRAHLCAADVHLASLDPAWQGLMAPSKLQASFAVARPVIFVGGARSETAAWIEKSGGGWVVDQNDLAGLLRAIREASNPDERRRRGQAAQAFARKNFSLTENSARMAQLLEGDAVSDPLSLRCSTELINT